MATTTTFKDFTAALTTSGYKWLTSTLLTAQQMFAVRPYFTCKIIDDTIQPNAQLFSGAGLPLGQGSMATAPDGKVFAVGLDGSNALAVWSDTDLNASAGVWANKTVLSTGSSANFADSRNVFSMAISDYINGSYRIDIYYFYNFANDGTALKIGRQSSNDGGATWSFASFTTTAYINNAIGNIGLAAFKPQWVAGSIVSDAFYIQPNTSAFVSGFTGYDIYRGTGGFVWGAQNVNSADWTIHSIAAYYFKGVQYCVFSGFRNIIDTPSVNANYSIFVTGLLNDTQQASTLWMAPIAAMPVGSASSTNLNSFTFPSATVSNGMVYITFKATLVDSLSQTSQGTTSQVVTTHTNYMLIQSDDGRGFSYPSVFVGTDGTEFNNGSYASFVLQNAYWYLGGSLGWLWQYNQNNITADVTADLINYQIQETAGQPSTVTMQIANANNKWVGASPTGQGAAAIAKNRKIAIWQGYYNAAGVPEAVPHSVYYIDDIQQTVTGTQNDLSIVGRDFYKGLKTTVTKFSYQFLGPLLFSDIFDGTFMGNWNQVSGTWNFVSTINPPLLNRAVSSGGEDKIMLIGTNGSSYGHLMRIFFRNAVGGTTPHSHVYFYAIYIDASNWLRLDIDTDDASAWKITKSVAGSTSDLDSGNLPTPLLSAGAHYYGIFIRRYSYSKFNFMIEQYAATNVGNEMPDYDPATTSYVFKNSGTGEYDLSTVFASNASWQTSYTVGIGTVNNGPVSFRFFSLVQLFNPNDLGNVIRRIARIAGIFSFKLTYTWRDLLFQPQYTGTFSVLNRKLLVTAGNQAIAQNNVPFSNGEISFQAKIAVANNSNPAGFSFIFRKAPDASTQDDYYKFHVLQASTGFSNPPTFFRFERYIQSTGIIYRFYNTPYDVSNNPTSFIGGFNFDLTKFNTFRIVMIDGWMYAFVNDVMVAAWNDNNTTLDYQTTGSWGFEADTNSSLQVRQIQAPNFWKPTQAFSYNPGDDAEGAIVALTQTLRAWFFSDLFGRFKAVFLSALDASTYTYNSQLYNQQVDDSDKEYVSQVTVYGQGVSATARNTNLMPGVQIREEVIIDYTITTQQDALTRAQNELVNINQFRNQNSSRQVINAGAEIFDAVTVINTGNNTSNVDGPTRVYSESFTEGGGDNKTDFSLEIDTGNL